MSWQEWFASSVPITTAPAWHVEVRQIFYDNDHILLLAATDLHSCLISQAELCVLKLI